MNSLEFINIEIVKSKRNKKIHIKFGQTNLAIDDEERLKVLYQIKKELEEYHRIKKNKALRNLNYE